MTDIASLYSPAFGKIVASDRVKSIVPDNIVERYLARHFKGDWGDLTDDDRKLNDQAFMRRAGGRLHSRYNLAHEHRDLWIITNGYGMKTNEPDLCYTTILFPSDY